MENRVYYVAMGDSLTEGVGASSIESSFAAKFFKAIRQTPYCQYVNLGRSGMSSSELLQYIEKTPVREQWQKATNITITIGGIDLIETYKRKGSMADYFTTIYKLKRNVNQLLQRITFDNPNAEVMIMGFYNPGHPDDALYSFANMLLQKVNKIYGMLAKRYNSHLVEPFHDFLNKPHLLADVVHPNDLGYETITHLFLEKRNKGLFADFSDPPSWMNKAVQTKIRAD
ncbi:MULTISPECIES: SGNH/GDSL hydrolase family protein [Aneurinibacillus]|uniref:Lysophospholipase L1 n=1 Tax=Aneurinibacillus thermoaerophilus TaxID=143495 RepID=A0A1G7Z010_ANETH|nr:MULTISPECIES: GDSL-type esterase/lipase family protein [Aneurinibacillus]AMA73125.1 hypothetical protein ACH33_09810 [Aneurinibacillus sp. XH2]MED0735999.1 GDSL-type esterase/lipase family protein [Aneurinibacillus thermoaerophilus]MED0756146.1 GDSL-type esterase/lipase family protein [Aneurinibacillus thermoaerophilus]MED0762379.1 GDSL-type esterase/lipase family protein [Aneurinibacillus thermoaerophilus]QYY44324.1 hypothetical protein K3F53_09215 [Aneurinibacillus thermoaerophilus]